jgi:signal peptidase II
MEQILRKYLRDYAFLFSIAGFIVLLDQYTKSLVRSNLEYLEMWSPWPWLEPYARIWHWHNTGASFGMFQGMGTIFAILALVVSIGIIIFFPRVPRDDWTMRLALALELGGAVGNLIDRVLYGYVTDFVSVGRFAVWNVADASITLGVVVMIAGVWMKERQAKSNPDAEAPAGEQVTTDVSEPPLPKESNGN